MATTASTALADRPIAPVREGTPPLAGAAAAALLAELAPGWEIVDGKRLSKTFKFADFASALAYVVKVGAMADQVDHHPDVQLSWGKATIEVWTHTVGGLAEIDFAFAARADRLASA